MIYIVIREQKQKVITTNLETSYIVYYTEVAAVFNNMAGAKRYIFKQKLPYQKYYKIIKRKVRNEK